MCKDIALSMELSTSMLHLSPTTMSRAQYNGYLMTEYYNHNRATFECVDQDPERIPGSAGNENGALFYRTEATCTGLPCPPYDPQKELTCAVCTK